MTATSHHQIHSGASSVGAASGAARERLSGVGPPESPAATRASRRTWKDPRLLVGVTIVAVCVLLGARLLATADDTVGVWAVRGDMAEGTEVTVADLERRDLRFASEDLAGRYLSADDLLPDGSVLTHDVGAGELLPRAALRTGGTPDLVEVPIALPSEAVPATLRSGELVDVWVTPTADAGEEPRAVRVLEQVRVVAVPRSGSALGPSSTRQVVVGLPVEDEGVLGTALARLSDGAAVIVRRG